MKKIERRARKQCQAYLIEEIVAMKPTFILCIGKSAYTAITRGTKKLKEVFYDQINGIYQHDGIDDIKFEWAAIPHPSGLNRFWNEPSDKMLQIIKLIQNRL